jgi:subfamily B ATP-binding cassette protein MsbA
MAETKTFEGAAARRLLGLARPYTWYLVGAAVCMVVSSLTFLAIPYAFRLVTDSVFVHHNSSQLTRVSLLLLVVVIISAIFGYGRSYLLNFVGGRVVADLRLGMYRHLLEQPLSFFDARRSGDLLSRLNADTTVVQQVLSNDLLTFFQNIIMIVGVAVIIVILDWRLALVMLAAAPLVALFGILTGRRTRRLSRQAQEQLGSAAVVVEETLPAMRVVKAFVREAFEMGRYRKAVEESFHSQLSSARTQDAFGNAMMTAVFGALAAVLWFGGREVLAGRLTPGGLISFLFYMTILIGPMQGLSQVYASFQGAAGGAVRVFEILDTPPTIVDAPDAIELPEPKAGVPADGLVEIRDLSFGYSLEIPVLRDVTMAARPGETVAIVGPSGAGKTTLMSLIPRFYEVTGGEILVDGYDIRRLKTESLRRAIGIVPQDATLFGGTVRENIAYGREGASQSEIAEAARVANAHEFILGLPQGYDSIIGDRGVKLSGGQRQRVAIARAVLKDPRILILDEATSSLDNESEALVQEALERLMEGRTTFVVAHRLTTIANADRIVVLDQGRVVEEGSHAQLMARDGLYQRLYLRSWEQELENAG